MKMLTERQSQILKLLLEGRSYSQIASELSISKGTVVGTWKQIKARMIRKNDPAEMKEVLKIEDMIKDRWPKSGRSSDPKARQRRVARQLLAKNSGTEGMDDIERGWRGRESPKKEWWE